MKNTLSRTPRVRRGATAGVVMAGLVAAALPALLSQGAQAGPVDGITLPSTGYQQAVQQAADPNRQPKVTVVATGGTLAGKARGDRASFGSYAAGTYRIADMLDVLRPELDAVADVDSVQFGNGGSSSYTIAKYRELTLAVEEALKTADGVVVTTGTDTMEEFAYWLDLTVQSKKPVVITGAMRPWAGGDTPSESIVLGTDGPANLFNAVKLAAGQQTYCFGTVLMLNDEIHTAREVRKGNTTRMDTFESPYTGPVGWVDQNATVINYAPGRAQKCDSDSWFTPFAMEKIAESDLPKVEIAYVYQEASGAMIEGFVADGATGIVTMGTGTGGLSGTMTAARAAAIRNGVWFTTTSRTGTGSASSSTSGSIISAGDLQGPKARLLLLLSRAHTTDIAQARTWFNEIGNAPAMWKPSAQTPEPSVDPSPSAEPTPGPSPSAEPSTEPSAEPSTGPSTGPSTAPSTEPAPTSSPTPSTPVTPVAPRGPSFTNTQVKIAKPVKVGKKFKVTVTVAAENKVAPVGTVTVKVNGAKKKSVLLKAGAKGKLTVTLPARKSVGTIGVEAIFSPTRATETRRSQAVAWSKVKRR